MQREKQRSAAFRMRLGRAGGFWRHIKQTNTYSGSNLAFVDGLLLNKTLIYLLY